MYQTYRAKIKNGFTIVETTLSMAFISLLLIAIVLVTNSIIQTYHRGLTIKSVNEVAYSLGEEFRRSIRFGAIEGTSDVKNVDGRYGVFCSGTYSYIWNYGEAIKRKQAGDTTLNLIEFTKNGQSRLAHLVKINDSSRFYCSQDVYNSATVISSSLTTSEACANNSSCVGSGDARVIELINPSDTNLVIHDFLVRPGVSNPALNQKIYQISFILGTSSGSKLVYDNAYRCNASLYDATYCALNRFDVSVIIKER